MIRLVTCLALLALASLPARAATVIACQDANGSDFPSSPKNPCTDAIVPAPLNGQGTFSAAITSTAINAALTRTANAAVFPANTLPGPLTLEPQGNQGVGIFVCWQGGTCTAAIGEYLAPGQSRTVSLPGQNMTTQPPTVISTGTPAVVVEW